MPVAQIAVSLEGNWLDRILNATSRVIDCSNEKVLRRFRRRTYPITALRCLMAQGLTLIYTPIVYKK
ncbi:Unannotated [Lentimonas sp. CC19]|nr:Unannotated [Lentimonas sp. CC19]CAA6695658.1 Unannotated [Lentimonas sp. CC10]CAA7071518.1 Unannotated [Lentimonas sp. CC11]